MTSPKPYRWEVSGLGLEPGLSGTCIPLCLATTPLERESQWMSEVPLALLGLARLCSPGLARLAVAFPLFLWPLPIQ